MTFRQTLLPPSLLVAAVITLIGAIHALPVTPVPATAATSACDPTLAFDVDGDGLGLAEETALQTDPCNFDSDADSCGDGTEILASPAFGGERLPNDGWDFFEVSGDHVIDLSDVLFVLAYYGTEAGKPSAANLDRWIPDESHPWRTARADDGIDLTDVLAVLTSYGHECHPVPRCQENFTPVKFESPSEPQAIGPITIFNLVGTGDEILYFDWQSTVPVNLVHVKGGPGFNTYAYQPPQVADQGLHAPLNNSQPYAISHILFCYDDQATLTPTMTTTPSSTSTSTSAPTRTATPAASATPTSGSSATSTVSATTTPSGCAYNGLVKVVGGLLEDCSDTVLTNLWLCYDQALDLIDNDGDSTIDNEPQTCLRNGEGTLVVRETVFSLDDCDSRNDDDDDDGRPVSNDPETDDFRQECPTPTLEDYQNGLVDKDQGELPEGLGSFEFQLKFDHKIFDISVAPSSDWTNGRTVDCSLSLLTENDIRFACTSSGTQIGIIRGAGETVATITVLPESDLRYRIRATKDNGVLRRLLDENCQINDALGDTFPSTAAGLTPDCTDVDITVRRLEADVDIDCDVDTLDQDLMMWRYASFFGSLYYDPNYDIEPWPNGDFDIDIGDVQFLTGRLGSTCEHPIPDNQDPLSAFGVGQP